MELAAFRPEPLRLLFSVLVVLAFVRCDFDDSAVAAAAGEDSVADDGATSRGMALSPGAKRSFTIECNEWFSCDGNVTVQLSDDTVEELLSTSFKYADQDEEGLFYYEPLYRIRAIHRATGEILASDHVSAYFTADMSDGELEAFEIKYASGAGFVHSSTSAIRFHSEDESAVVDVEIESLRYARQLELGISAVWE